ncbi:Threonine dehydratase biosynthetic, chloroplastic [Vitis vinifera]|uniref:Threonine dehydratase biosynthetic, chloroplastic n=1 Tax=Vitis vinifera TaxID=29760 RepID=A0A438FNM1_VITVI|nr:Threonine dehydratase biosynthetic, chloroplastic [Vitis vinifera]
MESLCFSTTHFSLLRPTLPNPIRPIKHVLIGSAAKPFIKATISKPAAEISGTSSTTPGCIGAVPDRTIHDGIDGVVGAMEYLTNILSSKVYDVAIESPLQLAPKLSERLGAQIWLKREDLQPVFSFKLRGAYNMMAKIPKEQLERGVICSSAGNHAQGVALAAKRLGCNAVIAMPVTTPEIKWKSVERLDVIMGQGTIGMEIVRQMQGPLDAIFVPVGGGGLIAGIAAYVKRVSPEVKIIGVEPCDANAMALSLHHDQRVMLDQVGGFVDGVAVKVVGEKLSAYAGN